MQMQTVVVDADGGRSDGIGSWWWMQMVVDCGGGGHVQV